MRSDGTLAAKAIRKYDLYILEEAESSFLENEQLEENLVNVKDWHERYGHLNVKNLNRLNNYGMVSGFQLNSKHSELIAKHVF